MKKIRIPHKEIGFQSATPFSKIFGWTLFWRIKISFREMIFVGGEGARG
jgi:hypothetical protein